MNKIYRKTATIKAEQFNGNDNMINKYHIEFDEAYVLPFRIETIEGWIGLAVGDWIETRGNGGHWPIADDVFRKTYAKLPVIPDYVANWIEECKQNNTTLSDALGSKMRPERMHDWMELLPGTYQLDYARYQKYQKLVARAWLDGYQVEEDK